MASSFAMGRGRWTLGGLALLATLHGSVTVGAQVPAGQSSPAGAPAKPPAGTQAKPPAGAQAKPPAAGSPASPAPAAAPEADGDAALRERARAAYSAGQ